MVAPCWPCADRRLTAVWPMLTCGPAQVHIIASLPCYLETNVDTYAQPPHPPPFPSPLSLPPFPPPSPFLLSSFSSNAGNESACRPCARLAAIVPRTPPPDRAAAAVPGANGPIAEQAARGQRVRAVHQRRAAHARCCAVLCSLLRPLFGAEPLTTVRHNHPCCLHHVWACTPHMVWR